MDRRLLLAAANDARQRGVVNGLVATLIVGVRIGAKIQEGVKQALQGDLKKCLLQLPKQFVLEIEFNNPVKAYKSSWYPGCKHIGERTIRFETGDYFEVMRALKFVV